MRFRFPPWLVLILLVGICASIIGVVALVRSQRDSTASLFSRLPSDDAVIMHIDFDALRRAGVLELFSGSDMVQEPEYRAFVADSGFNYLQDLDSALVSFRPDGTYFLLSGRFNWKSLRRYITSQGGSCYNTFCKVNGSTADRKISFFPLKPNVMALAVSKDDSGASQMLSRRKDQRLPAIPDQPVWAMIPASMMNRSEGILPGTRMFSRALENTEGVVLSAGPRGNGVELALEATCRSKADAAALVSELQNSTAMLRNLIARENKQPNPADLSGILAGGTFSQQDTRVVGRWPVERAFLEALAGGKS
ncbi:MAG: hypothetical protein M1436_03045 [Acidobacteria bacterium]|nr:hypothetical protein [Acidobacteriota bacterium]